MSTIERGPFLTHISSLEKECGKGSLTFQRIFDIFGADGHYILILIFILPFLQPVPMMGLSSIFGVLISLIAIFAYLKKPPFIPDRWKQKSISSATVLKITEGAEKVFSKIKFLIHPRMRFLFKEPFLAFNCLFLIWNSFLLALPIPFPFTNSMPAFAIFSLALGYLEEDGLFVIFSFIISIATLVYFATLAKGIELILRGMLGLV